MAPLLRLQVKRVGEVPEVPSYARVGRRHKVRLRAEEQRLAAAVPNRQVAQHPLGAGGDGRVDGVAKARLREGIIAVARLAPELPKALRLREPALGSVPGRRPLLLLVGEGRHADTPSD